MDFKKTLSTIEKIFQQNDKEKICIFIDGQWGIGKTFALKEFQEVNKDKYDVKYISVFGKDNLKSIEKELVMQMMSIFNLKKGTFDKPNIKIFGNIIKKISQVASGVDLNLSNLIDNIPIESISGDDNIVICIDDLERKSKNIDLKDLLGLIERTSSKFNVILIGSSINFNINDKNDFLNFKEKVIDFSFLIDELSNDTLVKIIDDKITIVDSKHKEKIIETFKKSRINNDIPLNNLRIFKKYIDLIQRLNLEINRLFNQKEFNLDEQLIGLCNYITYKNYLEHNLKNSKNDITLNYYKEEIKKVIESISRYEEYDEKVIMEYYEDYSEINGDIRKLRISYKLSKEKIINILQKIENQITEENLTYFIKQKYVISLYDILKQMGIVEKYSAALFNIVEKLYKPKIDNEPEVFECSDWNLFNNFGEQQNYGVLTIIKHVNEYNKNIYENFLKEKLWMSLEKDNLEDTSIVIKHIKIQDDVTFKRVFDWAFNKLDDNFSEDVWNLLIDLIYSTDTDIVSNFLINIKVSEKDHIRVHRINALLEELHEKKYYEYEAEQEEAINSEEGN